MKKFLRFAISILIVMTLTTSILSSVAADIQPNAVAKNETEPNDMLATANSINQDDTIYAKISSNIDVDYFKVTAQMNGTMNFWVGNIPSGRDYDLKVYNSSGQELGSSAGITDQELVTLPVTAGTTYYGKVYGYNGSYSTTEQYKYRTRLTLNTYNFFCQSPANFETKNLNNLYYKNKDGSLSSETWLSKINNGGCFVSSYAMVLKNLGATTTQSRYDVRTGLTTILQPDPFTVTLANTQWPSITLDANGKYVADTIASPVSCIHSNIVGGFGKTYTRYAMPASNLEKAKLIAYLLSLNPEGIIVYFENSSNSHAIVFTATTYEVPIGYQPPTPSSLLSADDAEMESYISEAQVSAWEASLKRNSNNVTSAASTEYDNLFTVYDPGKSNGAGILFSSSLAASQFGFGAAKSLFVVN